MSVGSSVMVTSVLTKLGETVGLGSNGSTVSTFTGKVTVKVLPAVSVVVAVMVLVPSVVIVNGLV